MNKKSFTFLTIFLLLTTIAFAQDFPEGWGTHADEGDIVKVEVRQVGLFESFLNSISAFSVGTFTRDNVFDKDWLLGEEMIIKSDETTFNLAYCQATKTVFEFYKKGTEKPKTYTSGYYTVQGNVYLTNQLFIPTNDLGAGDWTVVAYLWCADQNWKINNPELLNPVVSRASSQDFTIRESIACDLSKLPDGNVGSPKCEGDELVQDYRKNCELATKLVKDCEQTCNAGACVSFEEHSGTPTSEQPVDDNNNGVNDGEERDGSSETVPVFRSSYYAEIGMIIGVAALIVVSFALFWKRKGKGR